MSSELASRMAANALFCARLIAAAYSGRDEVRQLSFEFERAQFRYVDSGQWRAAVIGAGDTCYIGVAGSNDLRDWALNVSAAHDKVLPMHSGYRSGAIETLVELRRSGLRELIEGRNVVLSGHSSGGIMAHAMLHPAVGMGFSATEVHTFGAPRGFSPDMANWMNASPCKCYRFTMPGDPVPYFPLRRFRRLFARAQYAHAGQEVRLHDDGTIEAEKGCGIREKIKFALMLVGAYSLKAMPFRIVSVLSDKHSIGRYVRALRASQLKGAKYD
jgi:hypothetical protein